MVRMYLSAMKRENSAQVVDTHGIKGVSHSVILPKPRALDSVNSSGNQRPVPSVNNQHAQGMKLEEHEIHLMWLNTSTQIERYQARVNEGVELMAASEFGRWLRFSGFLKVFERSPQPPPLEVDAKQLKLKLEKLLSDCGEKLQQDRPGYVPVSALERVNHKLDLIAAHVAGMTPRLAEATQSEENIIPLPEVTTA